MTGPITFAVDEARNHLLMRGFVYTVRPDRTTGRTWARWSRLGPARADVDVEEVEAVDPDGPIPVLRRYADGSGFDYAARWSHAIRQAHGDVPDDAHVYRAELVALREAEP